MRFSCESDSEDVVPYRFESECRLVAWRAKTDAS